MNNNVFLDSDVILDLLCRREPFYGPASEIFTMSDSGDINLYTSSLVFANLYYILRKASGAEPARTILRKLSILVKILAVDEKIVELSLNSVFKDFEDGIQFFTARENNLDVLISRNVIDYVLKDILVQTPQEYLSSVRMSS